MSAGKYSSVAGVTHNNIAHNNIIDISTPQTKDLVGFITRPPLCLDRVP